MAVKTHRVVFREAAAADFLDVYRWIYEASLDPVTAERFVARLMAACRRIGDAPLAGRPRDDLWLGIHTISFERRAVIAYRMEEETVVIINVFYGGRDYECLLREEGRTP